MHRARSARAALRPPIARHCLAGKFPWPIAVRASAQTMPAPRARPYMSPAASDTAPLRSTTISTLRWREPGRAAAGIAAPDRVRQWWNYWTPADRADETPRDWRPRFPRVLSRAYSESRLRSARSQMRHSSPLPRDSIESAVSLQLWYQGVFGLRACLMKIMRLIS